MDSILCAGSTHVYRVGSLRCQCGQAANGYGLSGPLRPPTSGVMSYPWPAGYTPQNYRQPKPDPVPETSLAQLRAARDDVKATHLSADGKFAYTVRYGEVLQAEWDGAKYDSWWPVVGGKMPENAVKL